jgi:hypothetical protein
MLCTYYLGDRVILAMQVRGCTCWQRLISELVASKAGSGIATPSNDSYSDEHIFVVVNHGR